MMNSTAGGNKLHIGFFGIRNAGKSTIVNRLTNQEVSLVSDFKGTTTDPVRKAMELLPIGPVVIIDTAGFDDEGQLGELRKQKTYRILDEMDVVVLVLDARNANLLPEEQDFLKDVKNRKLPYIILENHTDEAKSHHFDELGSEEQIIYIDGNNDDMTSLKEALVKAAALKKKNYLVSDLVSEKSTVALVIPIDESAPKERIILPQQMVLRDLLDNHCKIICCQPEELAETLAENKDISLVITDSQVFKKGGKAGSREY